VIRDPIHRRAFGVAENCSFSEFVDQHLDCWALDPQTDWLTDCSGRIALDYIGLFENLEETFSHLKQQLGLKETELPKMLHSEPAD
jgi:hypothetical protein